MNFLIDNCFAQNPQIEISSSELSAPKSESSTLVNSEMDLSFIHPSTEIIYAGCQGQKNIFEVRNVVENFSKFFQGNLSKFSEILMETLKENSRNKYSAKFLAACLQKKIIQSTLGQQIPSYENIGMDNGNFIYFPIEGKMEIDNSPNLLSPEKNLGNVQNSSGDYQLLILVSSPINSKSGMNLVNAINNIFSSFIAE